MRLQNLTEVDFFGRMTKSPENTISKYEACLLGNIF